MRDRSLWLPFPPFHTGAGGGWYCGSWEEGPAGRFFHAEGGEGMTDGIQPDGVPWSLDTVFIMVDVA